jgi:hypothetical protein
VYELIKSGHLSEFWGLAALTSGSVMIAVAMLLLFEHGSNAWRRLSAAVWVHSALGTQAVRRPFGRRTHALFRHQCRGVDAPEPWIVNPQLKAR